MAISGKTCDFTTQYGIVRYGMEQLVKKTNCLNISSYQRDVIYLIYKF